MSSYHSCKGEAINLSLVHIYEADTEASEVSMRIRQKVNHDVSGEASRSHLHIRTLQNVQWRHFICYWLSNTETKDSKKKGTRNSKEKKDVGLRDLQTKEQKWNLPQFSSRDGSRR